MYTVTSNKIPLKEGENHGGFYNVEIFKGNVKVYEFVRNYSGTNCFFPFNHKGKEYAFITKHCNSLTLVTLPDFNEIQTTPFVHVRPLDVYMPLEEKNNDTFCAFVGYVWWRRTYSEGSNVAYIKFDDLSKGFTIDFDKFKSIELPYFSAATLKDNMQIESCDDWDSLDKIKVYFTVQSPAMSL